MSETTGTWRRVRRIAGGLSRLAVLVGAGTFVVGLGIAVVLTVALTLLG